jgi:hypothetical protein
LVSLLLLPPPRNNGYAISTPAYEQYKGESLPLFGLLHFMHVCGDTLGQHVAQGVADSGNCCLLRTCR